MAALLLELLSGEIPMSMQKKATEEIGKNVVDAVTLYYKNYNNFCKEDIIVSYDLYSARRIGLFINNLPDLHSELVLIKSIIKGPKIDCDDKILAAFMKKHEITNKADLIEDGVNYVYHQKICGKKEILKNLGIIIRDAILSYRWEKSMKWGSYEIEWVRPLYSVLCMYNEDVIPFTFGHLHSSNKTVGHRIYSERHDGYIPPITTLQSGIDNLVGNYFGECITISHASDYANILKKYGVIVSSMERVSRIRENISAIIPDSTVMIEDEMLLHTNSAMTEFPSVLLGTISEKYMSLPREVLITTVKHHQRCMMLQYKSEGEIAPYFIIVNDIASAHYDVDSVIRGNEKVVQARLEDARFIFLKECNTSLDVLIDKLKGLMFHEKIGSMYQKVERMKNIGMQLYDKIKHYFATTVESYSIERACYLSKMDLTTEMVSEFPELQGIIGAYYAKLHGESDDVVMAIKEHYHPLGKGDAMLPVSTLGIVLSLSDRLDTLNEMFEIGIKPSSTKDPYALRRAAISINRILACYGIIEDDIMQNFMRADVIEFLREKR
ncbi:Glycine--tRNA ligase beta subunit [Candidatus Fokinia solitaria]|uniref:glycine--tRNA ligase n=1 Tax=Candidatus Fokinia solitaria TaxID=1802984 RepID=A0A2U8BT15_9RICK|nr:glycine--tRNA ligase subunit beta [Candidatus Fokinia solitaria]AWD33504.1 Glycine--tRNA ligase beta subunit [Candidatus Fokinia solitaria]